MNLSYALLQSIDEPGLVVDCEGGVLSVNPSFRRRIVIDGPPLDLTRSCNVSELFDGGAREAVLDAVMKVGRERLSQRFFARNAGYGYAGIASPIVVDDALEAIVVLFHPAPEGSQRILNIQREIDDPLHEIRKALDIVLEQTGGRRASRYRYVVEGARHAAARALEWSTQLRMMLTKDELPAAESSGAFDPAAVLRTVAQATFDDASRQGVEFDLHSKNSLPPVRGDRIQLETMLIRLVRERLEEAQPLASLALSARSVGANGTPHVVMAVTEKPKPGANLEASAAPQLLGDLVQAIGGSLQNISNPSLGRSLVFRFPQAG